MKLAEIFENIRDMGIDQAVNSVEIALDSPQFEKAKRAIDQFIGIHYGDAERGAMFGVMIIDRLEAAYAKNPTAEGIQTREQIEKAFEPVRTLLRTKFGSTIRLYRGTRSQTYTATRNVLSWTSHKPIAMGFANVRPLLKLLSDSQIDHILNTYMETGEARYLNYTFKVSDFDSDYFDIYQDGQHITDDDDLRQFISDEENSRREYNERQETLLKNVIVADIDIGAIVWISDRMYQHEFIVQNVPNSSWHMG